METMSSKNEIVLSFHDTILYDVDVRLLDGSHWLNDSIIGFYLEYLKNNVYEDSRICFISPEVTQCLKLSPASDLPLFLDPLDFKNTRLALMPLNDCDDPSQTGGSHWSLLVYIKNQRCFHHFDSSQESNELHARILADKVSMYLDQLPEPAYRSDSSLQQTNSHDCGVFVLCNIDNVVIHFLRHGSLENLQPIKYQDVNKKRPELKTLIQSLASSGKQT